jgi:hypothetical protein
MATIRIDVIADIARRVGDDIRDLQASTDNWGNEDYGDALSYIGDLYQFAGAQMTYNTYANDANGPDRLTRLALHNARINAEEALNALGNFGFSYTIHDLIKEMN